MHISNIHEAKTHLSSLIEKALAGEEIIIAKAGKPMVVLTPYTPPRVERKPGILKGKVWYAPDYDQADAEIARMFEENEIFPSEDK